MTWKIRVLGAGAAALLFTQAAYAAPALAVAPIDPLVSLSMLSTAGSRAAICAGSTAAVAGAAAALAQGPAPGCVLPVTAPPPPPPAAAPPPPPPVVGAEAGPGFPTIPVLLGLAAIIAIAVALASSGNDHNAVSPA
jgi:hypothetical protein